MVQRASPKLRTRCEPQLTANTGVFRPVLAQMAFGLALSDVANYHDPCRSQVNFRIWQQLIQVPQALVTLAASNCA